MYRNERDANVGGFRCVNVLPRKAHEYASTAHVGGLSVVLIVAALVYLALRFA